MNARGNLQYHPVLKFFTVYNFEHHQLKIKFNNAFNFVNQSQSQEVFKLLLDRISVVKRFEAELYTNIDLYVYRRKTTFEIFRYQQSRYHDMLNIGIAHFSESVLQLEAFANEHFVFNAVYSLLTRAIETKLTGCIPGSNSFPCINIYISPWPFCPPRLNWTNAENSDLFLYEIRELIGEGIDSAICDFAQDHHDDSQMLQNLISSLFIVDRFFAYPRVANKSDFIVTFGGASATSDTKLAESDWWAHVADPRESSLYKRTLLMSEFFSDPSLLLFSTDDEPGHTAAGVNCAGISGRDFEYKHGALSVTRLMQNGGDPPFGIYGQVLEYHSLLDKLFEDFNEDCGNTSNCYALDEGASVIGFIKRHEKREFAHIEIGDHLSLYNLCLMKALVKHNIYDNYIYEDAFCFCREDTPRKPKNNFSTRFPENLISTLISCALNILSSILFALNFLFWSSCQTIFAQVITFIESAVLVEPKDVLFNFKMENQRSLCTIAFDKYMFTDKLKFMTDAKVKLDFSETGYECSGCLHNDYITIQRLSGSNLILVSVSAVQDYCASKKRKPQIYWKKDKDLCNDKDEDVNSAAACPAAIHTLEPKNKADSIYCALKYRTSSSICTSIISLVTIMKLQF